MVFENSYTKPVIPPDKPEKPEKPEEPDTPDVPENPESPSTRDERKILPYTVSAIVSLTASVLLLTVGRKKKGGSLR